MFFFVIFSRSILVDIEVDGVNEMRNTHCTFIIDQVSFWPALWTHCTRSRCPAQKENPIPFLGDLFLNIFITRHQKIQTKKKERDMVFNIISLDIPTCSRIVYLFECAVVIRRGGERWASFSYMVTTSSTVWIMAKCYLQSARHRSIIYLWIYAYVHLFLSWRQKKKLSNSSLLSYSFIFFVFFLVESNREYRMKGKVLRFGLYICVEQVCLAPEAPS